MKRSAKTFLRSLSLATIAACAFASDEVESTGTPEQVSVAGVVANEASRPLGSEEFSLRRRSTLELWRDRDKYREAIIVAARDDDPETAERARWILGRWQRGILSDTPSELAHQLAALAPIEAIERLLESGQFAAATIAMHESYGTLDFESISARVSITLDQRFPIYARAAVRSKTTKSFLDFLDAASSTSAMAVSRRDWAKLFATSDEPVAEMRLPESAKNWDSSLTQRTLVLLNLLAGEVNAAMEAARAADQGRNLEQNDAVFAEFAPRQQTLVRSVQMLTSQWLPMASAAAQSARGCEHAAAQLIDAAGDADSDAAPTSDLAAKLARYHEDAIGHWAAALIAADRGLEMDIRAQAVAGLTANLIALGDDENGASAVADARALAWRTLLIHGEIDAGLSVIGRDDPAAAAMIAANASRNADAFDRLGFSVDQIDTQLETWIDEAIAAQRELFDASNSGDALRVAEAGAPAETGVAPEIEKLFTLIRLLDGVNRDDAAWRIADRLSLPDLRVKRPQSSSTYLIRDYVMLSLLWTTHSDWMIRLGMRDWETESTIISRNAISQITVNDNYQVLAILQRFVQMQRPQATTIEAFQIACEIARADDVDRRRHADLVSELARSLRDGTLRHRVADEPDLHVYFRPSVDVWSELFAAHGRPDLAEPFLQRLSSSGDLKGALTLAKEYRLSGPSAISGDLYEVIWNAVAMSTSEGNPRFRDDVITAVTAVGEQWRAARDVGDQRTAEELLRQLRAMACTPSTDMRQQIADVLADLGQWQIADQIYRSTLVMTALTFDETQSMFDIARKYQGFVLRATASRLETTKSAVDAPSIGDLSARDLELRHQAITWVDIAFVQTLDRISLRPQLYLVFPRLFAREKLELALSQTAAKPPAAAAQTVRQLLDRLRQLDAMDITTAESILPRLSELGLEDLAAAELKRMIQAADIHLKTFPVDAVIANNVAWGAAVNNIELDDALRLSRHAVRFEPDSAIYRDTLAEILARRGNFDEAAQIERSCVIDDPGQWHLHEQVKRFEQKLSKSR